MTLEDENTHTSTPEAHEEKNAWIAPVLTKLRVEDAESGNNVSENGITGS